MEIDRTELETVLKALLHSVAGCRCDNWHDMGMPEISFEQAMAIELVPTLEHFSRVTSWMASLIADGLADSMVEVKDLKVFDDLYGFSTGDVTEGVWFTEVADMPTAHETLCAASYEDIWEALHNLWEENRQSAGPTCGHSACSQHYIDTGDTNCIRGEE